MLGASTSTVFFEVILRGVAALGVGLAIGWFIRRRHRSQGGKPPMDRRCFIPRIVFMACWLLAGALGLALVSQLDSVALGWGLVVVIFAALLIAERPLKRHEASCRGEAA